MSISSATNMPSSGKTRMGIVLRGGGAKGLALLGAVAELERGLRIKPQAYGGTSAGGLLAIALASGYSAEKLISVLRKQSFLDFFDADWSPDPYTEPWSSGPDEPRGSVLPSLFAGLLRVGLGVFGLRTRGGMYSSEPIGRWILHLLRWRPQHGGFPPEPDLQTDTRLGALALGALTVASSTGAKNIVTHSSIETPELDACLAARCTMSIPGVFHPIPLGSDLLMDGGLVANFPLEQFAETWPQLQTLGIFLCDTESSARQRDWTTSPLGIVKASLAVFLGQDEMSVTKEKRESIVWIDVTPIQTLDFDLTDDDKELLLECGRVGAQRWLREHAEHPIVLADSVPTNQEFTERVQRLRTMRSAARQRWQGRHRHRRLMLSFILLLPVLSILAVTLTGGFVLSAIIHGSADTRNGNNGLAGRRVLNIAVVRNGTADYADTAAKSFQQELEAGLARTSYIARFETAVGYPEADTDTANESVFRELIGRFESNPDYLVTIGTQVSIFAKKNYLGRIPLIFVSVTDPIDAGLVKHFAPDRSRGNIGGVAYGDLSGGLRFLRATFPGARLGFYYSSQIRQDQLMATSLAKCCPEVRLINDARNPLGTSRMQNIDLLFGWYYLNGNFLRIRNGFPGALVAGNERDMTRGAVAMLANSDAEGGALAAARVLLPSLLGGKSLSNGPVLRVNSRRFAVNRTIARHHGISVAASLPAGTVEFQ